MRTTIAAALAVTFLAGLAPAHAASPELIAAANKEGSINWYSNLAPANARGLMAAFQKKYPGISVKLAVASPADTVLKIQQEAKAGSIQADVTNGTSTIGPLKNSNLLECYIPDSAKNYPPELVDPDHCWVAQILYVYGVAINTDLVPEKDEPKTAQDLLDPKWKGKIVWAAQNSPGTAAGFIGAVLKDMGQDKGTAYLQALSKQQIVNNPANPRSVLDQLIAGQYAIQLTTFNTHVLASSKQGAPVKFLTGTPVWESIDASLLIKGGPHPNAGKLFVDFSLSKEGQEAFRAADSIPSSPDVDASTPMLKPSTGHYKATIFSISDIDSQLDSWVKVYNQYFK